MIPAVKEKLPIMDIMSERTTFRALSLFGLISLVCLMFLFQYQLWHVLILMLVCAIVYVASFIGPLYFFCNNSSHDSKTDDCVLSQKEKAEEAARVSSDFISPEEEKAEEAARVSSNVISPATGDKLPIKTADDSRANKNDIDSSTGKHKSDPDELSSSPNTELCPAERQSEGDNEALLAEGNLLSHQSEQMFDDKTSAEDRHSKPKETILSDVPGKPFSTAVYTDFIELGWEMPDRMTDTDTYQVRYKAVPNGKWTFCGEEFSLNKGYICGLMTDTPYVFKVRLVTEDGESRYSEESEEIRTQKSFASNILNGAIKTDSEGTSLEVYTLPMKENIEARNEYYLTRKYDIGRKVKNDSEKTIMLLGATGTGKSTLVDGLANYILGVNFEDPYRFTLASDDERKKQNNQAVSQTDWITCYSFHPQQGTKINYQLSVIDTPGFGDTRGLERDQYIFQQIRHLFNGKGSQGVQCIDAVCFLVKAQDARLTATQTYVFQSLVSLFGKDIEQNICTLVTFADGSDPPVLDAMKESKLPFGKHFTFNNSALFAKNQKAARSLAPMFWDMGYHSYVDFFNHLQTNEQRSLQLTKEVLQERYILQTTVEILHLKIDIGLSTVHNLKDRISTFEKNQSKINDNKDFEYEEKQLRQIKEKLKPGIHELICLYCNMTCHRECEISDDGSKAGCWAMAGGYCRICTEKCHWTVHKSARYRIEYREVTVKKTNKDMLKKYQKATGKKLDLEEELNRIRKELDDVTNIIANLMVIIKDCNNRLKEIALRPNPLEMVEQIDLIIQAEKMEQREGFKRRIKVLGDFRNKANFKESVKKYEAQKATVVQGKAKPGLHTVS